MASHSIPALARSIARTLPFPLRQWLKRLARRLGLLPSSQDSYADRMQAEVRRFSGDLDVHALPDVAHYWANTYLVPMQEAFGFSNPTGFFAKYLHESALRAGDGKASFISLGAGNFDTEIEIAGLLREAGLRDFSIECLEINPDMRRRGAELAAAHGVSENIVPVYGDFNQWQPSQRYTAVMANQSLHHVVNLEGLFDAVAQALDERGLFIVADMIGRNGHLRWPEAAGIVRELWAELPRSYRFNLQLRRREKRFLDWDCSQEGFEGIRAQDILPLLLQRFGFELFLGYGNLIDPFIDRSFGHHFDTRRDWDRAFIDRVHARDEQALQSGQIKPTHMLAVMCTDRNRETAYRANLSPGFCVRQP